MANHITLEKFINEIQKKYNLNHDRRFVLFLGAGTSISSGIPGAGTLVGKWLDELKSENGLNSEHEFNAWLNQNIPDFDPANPAKSYAKVIKQLYPNYEDRQIAIENITGGHDKIGLGYSILSQLMTHPEYGKNFNIILTTNFDNHLADSLILFSGKRPLVIAHDLLVKFVSPTRNRPNIIKLHGDAMFDPKNIEDEMIITKNTAEKLNVLLSEACLIFLGYSGNDSSISNLLKGLPSDSLSGGIFWVNHDQPGEPLQSFLDTRSDMFHVDHTDFDEVMAFLMDKFDLQLPGKARIDDIFSNIYSSYEAFSKKVEQKPSSAVEKAPLQTVLKKVEKQFTDVWEVIANARRLEKIDKGKAEKTYRKGLLKFPESPQLLESFAIFLDKVKKDKTEAEIYYEQALKVDPNNLISMSNFAVFLQNNKKDDDLAEIYFKRALEADPNDATTLGNYALFLQKNRKDDGLAETYYKHALEADPNHATNLGNYALFLISIRKDDVMAEMYFKRALEANPNHANNLGNYALFMDSIRKDADLAETYYKRALEADPNEAIFLGNYAVFLKDNRKDDDVAETYYKRALEADPNDATNLGNYAIFLDSIRKDADLAETYYKRALEADPNHAPNLGNYAVFLKNNRKDDMAETYYKRALEADPNNATNLGNYAIFQEKIRENDTMSETFYKRALEADPINATNLGNYAIFLKNIRKENALAETYYKRALEADPNHATNLGNYAIFLENIRKDEDLADTYYKRALEADPNHATNLGNYAKFRALHYRDYQNAAKYLKRAIELEPDSVHWHCNLGALLCMSGEWEEGIAEIEKALTLAKPEDQEYILGCWFHKYCNVLDENNRGNNLAKVLELIRAGQRCENWAFTHNIERAVTDGHPNPGLLQTLADVITGKENEKALEKFTNVATPQRPVVSPAIKKKIKVFISYSHADERMKNELDKHLSALKRTDIIQTWNDRKISPGGDWHKEIDDNIKYADIILVLVSANFLASSYCYEKEMAIALRRHKKGEAKLIPIILKPVEWHDTPLGAIQALPKDGKPISTWTPVDSGYQNATAGIKTAIENL